MSYYLIFIHLTRAKCNSNQHSFLVIMYLYNSPNIV